MFREMVDIKGLAFTVIISTGLERKKKKKKMFLSRINADLKKKDFIFF